VLFVNTFQMIVSWSDTSVCGSRDPSRSLPIDRVDLDHRKVVTYRRIASSDMGGKDLHGTHTVGF
jgi:hypothetical protein